MAQANQYLDLMQPLFWSWEPIQAQFEIFDEAPPEEQVANVNIVPRAGGGWVILQVADGELEIPGGTREPGETWLQTARRELMEEAGCQLDSHQIVGGWRCRSLAKYAYRPHLPHPEFYRLVLTGWVTQVAPPINPPDGEPVVQVKILPLSEVTWQFRMQEKHYLADLYQFAAAQLE